MDDELIVKLYWDRSENAISETSRKYGAYCNSIAYNILQNSEDAEESVNDTYMDAWNAMPPHRPSILATFLGKITRRISIDRWRSIKRIKRGGGACGSGSHHAQGYKYRLHRRGQGKGRL